MSAELDEELQNWLQTPEGRELLQKQSPSIILTCLHSCVLLLAGLVCCSVVILIWPGIKWLWRGITFEPMRNAGISAKQAATLQAVVAYPIMTGPAIDSAGTTCPALLVSELQGIRDPQVGEFARRCYELYAGEKPSQDDHQLTKMLKDDAIQTNRRRSVPKSSAPGRNLFLLDVWLNPEWNHPISGYAILAASPGSTGVAFQVPFVAVSPPPNA